MGGFFGITGKRDCVQDVFFGVDYHSHLGKARAGLASLDPDNGFQREIHNIENSPFRTKFDNIAARLHGNGCIGCISDQDPQPLLIKSKFGLYAMAMVGMVTNGDEIVNDHLKHHGGMFQSMSGNRVNTVDILAALISQKDTLAEGIRYAQDTIQGSACMLLLCENGHLIAARDKRGRLPVLVGKSRSGYCVSFESFAYEKLGYLPERELRPGEIVELSATGVRTLYEGGTEMRMCSFLWTYYGFPTSSYEGVNVETMRYRNGEIMAENDERAGNMPTLDSIAGIPDSGTPHAIGYANQSGKPFARAFIKYTPTWSRSFMPARQTDRNKIAKMKQIPVYDLIKDKNLLFVDDSIVRGTQLRETVEFLYENGAKSVHMRSACPPIMFGCKYLNFSRSTSDMELIARRVIMELEGEEGFKHIREYSDGSTERGKNLRKTICEKLKFASLDFQSLDGIIEAIGMDKNDLCTYCWDGEE